MNREVDEQVRSRHELLDPPFHKHKKFDDPTDFYTDLMDALREGEPGMPEYMALNHIYQHYYSQFRLIQYDLRIDEIEAQGALSEQEALDEGEIYQVEGIRRTTEVQLKRLNKRAESEEVKLANFSQKTEPFAKGDPKNVKYGRIYDLWTADVQSRLGHAEFERMRVVEPRLGTEHLMLGAVGNMRDTIGLIRDSYYEAFKSPKRTAPKTLR